MKTVQNMKKRSRSPDASLRRRHGTQNEPLLSYAEFFTFRSAKEAETNLKEFEKTIECILKVSPFEGHYLRITNVVSKERIKHRGRLKMQICVQFEKCEKSEAHCYFSAKLAVLPASDMNTLVRLMIISSGSVIDRRAKASSFNDRAHGQVKIFDSFMTDVTFCDNKQRRMQIVFAAAQAHATSSPTLSYDDPTELREQANR